MVTRLHPPSFPWWNRLHCYKSAELHRDDDIIVSHTNSTFEVFHDSLVITMIHFIYGLLENPRGHHNDLSTVATIQ